MHARLSLVIYLGTIFETRGGWHKCRPYSFLGRLFLFERFNLVATSLANVIRKMCSIAELQQR